MQHSNLRGYIIVLGAAGVLGFPVVFQQAAAAVQPPREVRIDILEDRYGPVLFDHELHDGYASCVECHHHVAGAPPSDPLCLPCHKEGRDLAEIGCRRCHAVDRYAAGQTGKTGRTMVYHDDTPGLIGAYHLNCISCHTVIGTGPTGCEGCHEKHR